MTVEFKKDTRGRHKGDMGDMKKETRETLETWETCKDIMGDIER
jgi:hypothetical protein